MHMLICMCYVDEFRFANSPIKIVAYILNDFYEFTVIFLGISVNFLNVLAMLNPPHNCRAYKTDNSTYISVHTYIYIYNICTYIIG